MKRYPHYWWQLRGKYCPSRIAVLDCDREPGQLLGTGIPGADRVTAWSLALSEMKGGAVVRRMQRSGERAEHLWPLLASLCTSKETTWILCYDAVRQLAAIGFWDRLEDGRIRLAGKDWRVDRGCGKSGEDRTEGLCCIEDPPTLILCQLADRPGKLLILDARNYGIENGRTGATADERSATLMAGILSIVSTLRAGTPVSLRGTAASQAVQILRTRYDCVRLHCHTASNVTQLERAAYFGGRVEAYRTGAIEGPVWHLDVRNMYPSVCLTLPIPVSLSEYTDERSNTRRLVEKCPEQCCAVVRIRANGQRYPVRDPSGIVYPDGDVQTALAGPELQSAVRLGAIESVVCAARYTCAPVLAGFYQWGLGILDGARKSADTILAAWIKRVMNALVGKFGEPGRRWVARPPLTEMGPYAEFDYPGPDGQPVRHRNIAWQTQRLETHGESYWSMPAVAAFICSAARTRLYDIIRCAGRENVWYVDTDGILCNGLAREKLLSERLIRVNEVGYLREVSCYSSVYIHGIRHYEYDGKIKCAGVAHGQIRTAETREDYWHRNPGAPTSVVGYLGGLKSAQHENGH